MSRGGFLARCRFGAACRSESVGVHRWSCRPRGAGHGLDTRPDEDNIKRTMRIGIERVVDSVDGRSARCLRSTSYCHWQKGDTKWPSAASGAWRSSLWRRKPSFCGTTEQGDGILRPALLCNLWSPWTTTTAACPQHWAGPQASAAVAPEKTFTSRDAAAEITTAAGATTTSARRLTHLRVTENGRRWNCSSIVPPVRRG